MTEKNWISRQSTTSWLTKKHEKGIAGKIEPHSILPPKLDRIIEASQKESIEYIGSFLFPANA
jgi:hypothetical protein